MWVKVFKDGSIIEEDRDNGITWRKTPLNNIQKIYIKNGATVSPALSGYDEYWHSRTGVVFDGGKFGENILVERIQGRRDDGNWDTIEVYPDGTSQAMVLDHAPGKPVIR